MSDMPPPPPPPPPAGGTPPPEPTPGQYGAGQYGAPQYGAPQDGAPSQYGAPATGGDRPGELLDRFLARLIDGILIGIVYFIISAILGAILITNVEVDPDTLEISGGSTVLFNIVFSIIFTGIYLGYFALMESSRGQSLGKMAMKLKVVGPGGGNPTLVEAVKRNIWAALTLLAILGTIGSVLGSLLQLAAVIFIAVGISQDTVKRQHWFDHFAGETAVRKIG